jgi:hypothetical protein
MSRIIGAQIRAARALVRWRAEDLAQAAKIGVATVRRAEGEDERTALTAANETALRSALEDAGVVFVAENGDGPGVRLRKGMSPSARAPQSSAELQVTADDARSHAGRAVDRALSDVEATDDEKAGRRERLTAVPDGVRKARKQNKGSARPDKDPKAEAGHEKHFGRYGREED